MGLAVFFVAIWLYPVSNVETRSAGIVVLGVLWFGLVALLWRSRSLRVAILAFTVIAGLFMALPGRSHPDIEKLRSAYVTGLRRYEGDKYYWGGESPKGIDCSGLIRRGMIDGLFLHGLQTMDAGLVRHAIWVWWNDRSAADFGSGKDMTTRQFTVKSINDLDSSRLLPGDLAVTANGAHIMAYLGSNTWIEADPGLHKVISETAPANDNGWFQTRMNIVRWNILSN